MGIFRSKIEVKSRKSLQREFLLFLSILFFTFERCVNVSKIFLPSFKVVRRFWRDFFQKSDGRRRSKEAFLPPFRGEYSSLIHRVVTMVMEYRIVECPLAIATSDVCTLPARPLQILQLSFEKLSVVVELPTFVDDHVAIYVNFSFKVKKLLFEQTFCHLMFPVRGRRRSVEKVRIQSQHGRSSSRLAVPVIANRQAHSGYALLFTRNDSLRWLVESERRWRTGVFCFHS